ncbi:GNAT family N-acetyltransferase [Actinoplanes couchii]|uniref:N-acetyltransferase domain-containing protein n=1 Tax=Actinoplanes couchii TaxID=403638 RepID=A0ABQ3XM89_9ACTN|nr:GNAT family N-acetyltransferase [Actinoplanes couchii]MDR6321531.1 GNAT superfamily N-acetyltransferase [Actinoplanes couchii]GID59627.1 hypothetical protein Aco03nite_080310 [Actinoplanes couchii]
MGEVSVRFLAGEADTGTLRRLYDSVFTLSFVAAEREPFERLTRVLAADELRGAVALTPDGEPVGALFLEWFADIRAGLLCYFAVRPDLRDGGIGRRLIAEATPRWRTGLRPRVVFAEAGDPTVHGGGEHTGDGDARLRMYAGFGASRLPLPYLMPELSPGTGRAADLLLLVAETDPPSDRIRGDLVEGFLTRYFARQEGHVDPDDDSRLKELLARCRETEFLPLLPLSGE